MNFRGPASSTEFPRLGQQESSEGPQPSRRRGAAARACVYRTQQSLGSQKKSGGLRYSRVFVSSRIPRVNAGEFGLYGGYLAIFFFALFLGMESWEGEGEEGGRRRMGKEEEGEGDER